MQRRYLKNCGGGYTSVVLSLLLFCAPFATFAASDDSFFQTVARSVYCSVATIFTDTACTQDATEVETKPISPEESRSSPPPSHSTTTIVREVATEVIEQTPTYVTNEHVTNPTVVVRESADLSDYVTRDLLVRQLDSINDSDSDDQTLSFASNILSISGGNSVDLSSLSDVGVTTFAGLTDTPANYSGAAGQWLAVNAAGDAVEFVATSTLRLTESQITDLGSYVENLSSFDTDDLSEGASNRYYTDARARAALSSSATGLTYTSGTGVFSLTSGYTIPLTASTTEWATAYGWGNHASAGYLVASNNLSDLTSSSTARTNLGLGTLALLNSVDISDNTNLTVTANGLTLSGDALALASGYTIPQTASTTEWATAYGWGDHSTAGYLTDITGESVGDLSDITLSAAANGELLQYNGSNWVNVATSSLGINSSLWSESGSDIYFTGGDVSIGTTTPSSRLTIFETVSDAQVHVGYDATRFAELQVDAAGDLILSASGGNAWFLNENFYVCAGGACPTPDDRIGDAGNVLVENTLVAGDIERQCPSGYIWVAGSAKYGTLPGFCVMKYEAKNDGSNNAVSTATSNPWVGISQENARATCQAIGPQYHLISEAEWMTIAEQIANLPINDLDDDASLQLANGHSDNAPGNALAATDAADPVVTSCNLMETMEHADNAYSAGACEIRGTGAGGSTADDKGYYGTGETWSSTGYSSGAANKSQLRTHVLANGEVIWDIGGNVWEWTDRIAVAAEHPEEIGSVASEWLEYTAGIDFKGLGYLRPPDDSWNATNGIGRMYTDVGDTATAMRAFLRGGDWDYTSYAGVFTLLLNYAPTSTHSDIGFRCAR